MKSQVVLITGASSGIGAALARAYDRRGARLALLARRKDKLTALARECGNATAIACDVDIDESVEAAFREALGVFGRLDVVVANAGISVPGTVERLSIDDFRRQMETNVLGAVRTAKAAIAPLRETKGRLGIVGSVNGYLSLPGFSAYAMSKFAVRALCDALRGELRKDGISVTHIAPGFVESEIRLKDGQDPIPSWIIMKGKDAAEEIVAGLERRKANAIITAHGRAFVALQRRAPKMVDKLIELNAARISTAVR
jgi:short-subunit dehydrogenase